MTKPRTPPICPSCGSDELVPIVYGLPGGDLMNDAREGRVMLGGCMVSDFQPTRQCRRCGATSRFPQDEMEEEPMITVTGMDHIVLRVADAEASLAFYLDELGLEPVRVDEWRRGEVPFASVRIDATTIIDLLEADGSGQNLDHLCLVIESTDLDVLAADGGFEVVDGPAVRFGAQGEGRSLYVLDPDGNVVELRHY